MIAIGLDGFRKGWVAITIEGNRRSIHFPDTISWLATQSFERAAIDIPIGMNEDGERACDRAARKVLSPHGSRVFGGARRWLWKEFADPAEANREADHRGQKKVSRQLWHIGRKIIEVDDFVLAHRKLDIRETHPELVFLRLNGNKPLESKHSQTGLAQRSTLLVSMGFKELDEWLTRTRIGQGAKRDDVLDACACAIAARHSMRSLPEGDVGRDGLGLPMQIWY
jgi:predicted RNase H-like nuclease